MNPNRFWPFSPSEVYYYLQSERDTIQNHDVGMSYETKMTRNGIDFDMEKTSALFKKRYNYS